MCNVHMVYELGHGICTCENAELCSLLLYHIHIIFVPQKNEIMYAFGLYKRRNDRETAKRQDKYQS